MMVRGSPKIYRFWVVPWLLAIALNATALEVQLTYETQTDEGKYFPHGYQGGNVRLEVPQGRWELPDLVAKTPAYTTLQLGDNEYLLVFDFARSSNEFYNRLYFDANGNRDLRDDPVISAEATPRGSDRSMFMAQFPRIELTVTSSGSELPYSFTPTLYCFMSETDKAPTEEPNARNMHFNIRTNCAYRGAFTLDETDYEVWLGDSNGNAKFGDAFAVVDTDRANERVYATGDTLYVVNAGESLSYESGLVLGDFLALHNQVFSVRVKIPEGNMELAPLTTNLATLEFPIRLDTLQIYSDDGSTSVMLFKPELSVQVPASQYRLASYKLHAKGGKGDLWTLQATGGAKGPVVSADVGKTETLILGEPFTPVVGIPEYAREGMRQGARDAVLEFQVRGAGEEYVVGLRRISGENAEIAMSRQSPGLPAEPTYKIVSDEGEVVTSGKFDYG